MALHLTGPIFTDKHHQVWRSSASKQIDLQARDWSYFEELNQLFEMGPISGPWLYQFRSCTSSKLMLFFHFSEMTTEKSSFFKWSLNIDCLGILEAEKRRFVIGVLAWKTLYKEKDTNSQWKNRYRYKSLLVVTFL